MPENIPSPTAQEITLREHLERLIREIISNTDKEFTALRRELDLSTGFNKEANLKADKIEEEWRQAANEWRGAMDNLINKYATVVELGALEKGMLAANEADRSKHTSDLKSLEARVYNLEIEKSGFSGRIGGITATVAAILALIGIAIQFIPKE